MTTRNNLDINLKHEGYIKNTKHCKGPQLSTNKGNDFPCCCTCDNLRTCSRKPEEFFSSTSEKYQIYIDLLKKKIPSIDIESSFSMSNCGKKFFIRKKAIGLPEPEPSSYVYCILDQFIVLKQMGFRFLRKILLSDVSYTKLGIPIYYPDFEETQEGQEHTEMIIERNNKKYFKFEEDRYSFFHVLFSFIDLLTSVENCTLLDGQKCYLIPKINYESPIMIPFSQNSYNMKISGNPDDKYVILDLDKTLINSDTLNLAEEIPNEKENSFIINLASRKSFFNTRVRRHLKKFLDDLIKEGYKIIIWSAGTESYVKVIVSVLFKDIDYVYIFTRCHVDESCKKRLELIGNFIENFNVRNCRLVDDDERLHKKDQEENFVKIPEFNEDDDVLEDFIIVVKKSFETNQ